MDNLKAKLLELLDKYGVLALYGLFLNAITAIGVHEVAIGTIGLGVFILVLCLAASALFTLEVVERVRARLDVS